MQALKIATPGYIDREEAKTVELDPSISRALRRSVREAAILEALKDANANAFAALDAVVIDEPEFFTAESIKWAPVNDR